jgi:hypothetical protein
LSCVEESAMVDKHEEDLKNLVFKIILGKSMKKDKTNVLCSVQIMAQVVQWPININVSSSHVRSRIQLVSSSTKPLLPLGSSEEQFVLQTTKFALED